MRFLAIIALLAATPAFAQTPPAAELVVIHAGTLLDRPGRAPRRNASVHVRSGRIVAVRDGYEAPAGARIVDLRDRFVLPGLIDAHVHLDSDRAGNEGLLARFGSLADMTSAKRRRKSMTRIRSGSFAKRTASR